MSGHMIADPPHHCRPPRLNFPGLPNDYSTDEPRDALWQCDECHQVWTTKPDGLNNVWVHTKARDIAAVSSPRRNRWWRRSHNDERNARHAKVWAEVIRP